ncbi:MAG: fibrillarin-like rRNA/tRNA 2'-O-methyltransferase [Candidatus Aenigmatarchaeota archaeon]
MKEIFPRIFLINDKLATLNSIQGFNPFDEELIKIKNKEYRIWDPHRSKAAAAIVKGIKEFPIKKGNKILYLGAAHGYTCSFLANIIENGIIYAIEFSERCFNELLPLCEKYKNIVPILADARKPEKYNYIEKVDVVYCDLAQPDQTEIAIRNCKKFLKSNGYLFLVIKTRSIDVTKSPKIIVEEEIKKLRNFKVIDWKMLDPYEKDHGFVIAKK